MRNRGLSGLLLVAALALAAETLTAQISPTFGSGRIARFNSVVDETVVCTTSPTFQDLPSLTTSFGIGSQSDAKVVIQLAVQAAPSAGPGFAPFAARVLIDGVPTPLGAVRLHLNDQDETENFTWVSQTLAGGFGHTATVQWRAYSGGTACVAARTLVVYHP